MNDKTRIAELETDYAVEYGRRKFWRERHDRARDRIAELEALLGLSTFLATALWMRKQPLWAGVFLAAALLTKGPVALAVPLMVAAPYAVWRGASLAVWHPLGPVVLAGLVSPWVWAVSREIPDFLHYVVVTETWERMATDELRRTQPFWYFVPVLLAGAFPWSIVALSGLRPKVGGDPDRRAAWIYLMLWLLVPLGMVLAARVRRSRRLRVGRGDGRPRRFRCQQRHRPRARRLRR